MDDGQSRTDLQHDPFVPNGYRVIAEAPSIRGPGSCNSTPDEPAALTGIIDLHKRSVRPMVSG